MTKISGMFKLNLGDVYKGLVMAVLAGLILPVAAAIQTPGFSLATADWHQIAVLAENGALVGFMGYIVKNFFSDQSGKVLGAIG